MQPHYTLPTSGFLCVTTENLENILSGHLSPEVPLDASEEQIREHNDTLNGFFSHLRSKGDRVLILPDHPTVDEPLACANAGSILSSEDHASAIDAFDLDAQPQLLAAPVSRTPHNFFRDGYTRSANTRTLKTLRQLHALAREGHQIFWVPNLICGRRRLRCAVPYATHLILEADHTDLVDQWNVLMRYADHIASIVFTGRRSFHAHVPLFPPEDRRELASWYFRTQSRNSTTSQKSKKDPNNDSLQLSDDLATLPVKPSKPFHSFRVDHKALQNPNYISNHWKYTSRTQPYLDFSTRKQISEFWIFAMRREGIQIDKHVIGDGTCLSRVPGFPHRVTGVKAVEVFRNPNAFFDPTILLGGNILGDELVRGGLSDCMQSAIEAYESQGTEIAPTSIESDTLFSICSTPSATLRACGCRPPSPSDPRK